MPSRRAFLIGSALAALPQRAGAQGIATEPVRVPIELFEEALELQAAVRVGSRRGDVTLVEFFDYNCPWCKRSARDLGPLLANDPDLSYLLVNFAVLGAPSVQATKVALGFHRLHGPDRYLSFHQAVLGLRGPADGARAIAEAAKLGADEGRLVQAADSPEVLASMKEALRVGNSLGLVATPSFVIGPEAYLGHLGLDQKRRIVAEARS